ncbi:MAG: stalk domain-containing protein [Eubacteriales bacterium]|jgi:hypothetical protein
MSTIKNKAQDAFYLIDDDGFLNWGKLMTSWDYISDGEGPKQAIQPGRWLLNTDKDGEVCVKRDCNAFENGKMTYEIRFETLEGDGLYLAFGSRTDAFLTFTIKGETLYAGKTEVAPLPYGMHYLKIGFDMTAGTASVQLDTKDRGTFAFEKAAFPFTCLRIGYGEKDRGAAYLYQSKLYVNYLFNDYNLNPYIGAMPDGYTVKAPKTSSVVSDKRVSDSTPYTYMSHNKKGDTTVTYHAFDKASGKVTFEMKYLLEQADGKVSIALLKGSKPVVSVYDEGEELHCYCGHALRKHHKTVWQTLRMEADTDSGKATIWLNGKKTKVVDFENPAKFVDGFRISYEAYKDSLLMFSDIIAWVKPEEPEDYVPAPVVPKKKGDYVVGMNICSLWREGSHAGWDCISPYDDVNTVLGFYDEGLPETSDWEIKFMVEHGIDYELYCWYSAESHEPIKSTHLHYAWLDGHFYAKYAEYEKFALLWEAANCKHPTCLEDFKYNLVPYWLDYFFSDDRYMRIDNKAVMSCFGVGCVENDLGGPEKVREGLQYLRDEVKKLGYDDLIVMGCHADPNQLKNLGFDAFHAYHWGGDGYKLQTNIDSNLANIKKNAVHIVPTVSVGFKNVGWGGNRRPNLPCQDMYNGLKYCMDEILPTYEKGTWKSKMLHLSTWNEYGEGTYMMPSGLNGFGYLDAVRKAVCVDEPHEDIVPTEAQKARIGHLHLPDRYILSRTKYDVRPLPETDTPVATYTFETQADLDKWTFNKVTDLTIKDGCVCGKATEQYPEMELKDVDFDASTIAYAKAVLTNRHGDYNGPTVCYLAYATAPDKSDYSIPHKSASAWCSDTELKEYRFELDTMLSWSDTIHGLKFIPTYSGSFTVKSITLYASLPHTTLYGKNGRELRFGDYLPKIGGELYVPLDPDSGLYGSLGYKYEWIKKEGRLEIFNKEHKITLVIGKAYAVKDGESFTLVRPPFFKDGIPTISLADICKLFDVSFEEKGNKVFFK